MSTAVRSSKLLVYLRTRWQHNNLGTWRRVDKNIISLNYFRLPSCHTHLYIYCDTTNTIIYSWGAHIFSGVAHQVSQCDIIQFTLSSAVRHAHLYQPFRKHHNNPDALEPHVARTCTRRRLCDTNRVYLLNIPKSSRARVTKPRTIRATTSRRVTVEGTENLYM